ncbi:MAG: NADH-quinone oxidoreductase subunit NuoG [Armatimonadetes bacterium]|nr:NADH-quinone oxidoreductase subunit NuoG [Armatimonadota bacterium]
MQDQVTITINGIDLEVPKGEIIVESVKRLGLEIPIFCYHSRMKPVGMCRMCLIEVGFKQPDGTVRMMPKPQAGCTLGADKNMVILTDTESIREDRKGVLEFLLINHPLDCPVCDRGGECPLQNNTLFYGPSTSRYVESKRHLPKAFPLSEYVTLDLERCIQCGRCVRFTEEISGDAQLAFLFRGAAMQPRTFELTDFDSKFSGNVIEICPVGALTSTQYRFRARPWDLESRPSICTECSNGCNVWFDYRVDQMVRISGRTNEEINEEWTCDKGKFGQDYLNSKHRLRSALVRQSDTLVETGWAEAYGHIIDRFKGGGSAVAGLTSGRPSNEDLYLFKGLFKDAFESGNLDHRWYAHPPNDDVSHVESAIVDFEASPTIVIFGGNLAAEQPIVFLRIRKTWFKNGAKVIVASSDAQEADTFASKKIRYEAGKEPEAIKALKKELKGDFIVAASRSLYNLPNGQEVVAALKSLGGKVNLFATEANEQGALDIGILPENGMRTREILESCRDRTMKSLWLLQCDPFALWPDQELVKMALENVEFLVVHDIIKTKALQYASVVLPACAFSEMDGSYTNCERRVQHVQQILAPKGMAKPAWKAFGEITMRMLNAVPPFNADEVFEKLASEVPAFGKEPAAAG